MTYAQEHFDEANSMRVKVDINSIFPRGIKRGKDICEAVIKPIFPVNDEFCSAFTQRTPVDRLYVCAVYVYPYHV